MPPLVEFSVSPQGRAWVRIEGDVTAVWRQAIADALGRLKSAGPLCAALVDATLVTRLDSAGVDALRSALSPAHRVRFTEPIAVPWAAELLGRAFPGASLHPCGAAMERAEGLQYPGTNRRTAARRRLRLRAKIDDGAHAILAWTRDLSRRGACLVDLRRGAAPFPAERLAGARLRVCLGRRPPLLAAVVRLASEERPAGIGVRFLSSAGERRGD